jgi:two-component system, OmpR family, phosphate regulon sensor histidine kinase PhoR
LHRAIPLVTAATRRIWFYWLLLLLPAAVVGVSALLLLRREQVRVVQQTQLAAEARRAAVLGRAQLAAENIGLLIADVQSHLLQTLQELPLVNGEQAAADWRQSNPLVLDVFEARPDGGLRWGGESAGRWLATDPWRREASPPAPVTSAPEREAAANVAQFQRARAELQESARMRQAPAAKAMADVADESAGLARPTAAGVARPTSSGWSAWEDGPITRMFGWQRLSDGTLRGVELNVTELLERAQAVIPAATPEERYELRPRIGPALRPDGPYSAARDAASVAVALPPELLPGWEVAGALIGAEAGGWGGVGLFSLGTLLIGLLVVAIATGGVLLLRDARRSEAEALQKTTFVANVSHELKTPLTTIRLYSELLGQDRIRDAGERAAYLATITRETERLGRMVNNVLDFSRLEQGRRTFLREEVDLAAELKGWLEAQAPCLDEAGLEVHLQLPPAPLCVQTDRDAVHQVVLNLLDNAAKYASDGGEVSVSLARAESGVVELRVGDRGPGVPSSQRERIFDRFQRLDDSLTAPQRGAGLGLSIARALAGGLGGELGCISRTGGGAEFVLTLPSTSNRLPGTL